MEKFRSQFENLGQIALPAFAGTRVMMMPFVIGDGASIPDFLAQWKEPLATLSAMSGYLGEVGYITIDEKEVIPGKTHRRSGLHVDGVFKGASGSWGGGDKGGSWGGGIRREKSPGLPSVPKAPGHRYPVPGLNLKPLPESEHGTGFLTVASHPGCKAWQQDFVGWPGDEGECEHLAGQCHEETAAVFGPNEVFWVDPLCVHQSLPMSAATRRQFVRLSLPSEAPWFEGYTENPLGVMPTGAILPARPEAFMMA